MVKKGVLPRERRETHSAFRGVLVKCKCPYCEVIHEVQMAKRPKILPRIYCVPHGRHREEG
jgi:hypothetical protein